MAVKLKAITVLIALVLCVSLISGAFALYSTDGSLIISFEGVSSTPATVTLYYFNIHSWDNVCAYVWDSSGNYKEAYPGNSMTVVSGKDGWYSIEIPNGYGNVLFNSGDNSNETENLTVDGSNLYFDGYQWNDSFNALVLTVGSQTYQMTAAKTSDTTVASQYTATVYLNEGDEVTISDDKGYTYTSAWQNSTDFSGKASYAGEYTFYAKRYYSGNPSIWTSIPTITVYYYNVLNWDTVSAYAWDNATNEKNAAWPGVAMSAVKEYDKWYSVELPLGAYDRIIFNNSDKGSQTQNLVLNTATPYFNGYEWTNGFNLYKEKTKKIYFKNTASWSNVYCHHWNSSTGTTWPGDKMTSMGDGWYYVEVQTADTYVIFHNNSGTQTGNIPISPSNWYFDYSKYDSNDLTKGWLLSMS